MADSCTVPTDVAFVECSTETVSSLSDIELKGKYSLHLRRVALRSQGASGRSKKFMFAYTGDVADGSISREKFIELFYAVTDRRDIKFGPATWISTYKFVSASVLSCIPDYPARPNLRMVDKMRDGRVMIAGGQYRFPRQDGWVLPDELQTPRTVTAPPAGRA